jgi:hypothetical protein
MKNIIQPMFMLLVTFLLGCVEKDDLCCGIQAADQLSGRWLLYEVGYSPGFEYMKEAISPNPAQTLTFGPVAFRAQLKVWRDSNIIEF